jgi:hypothetical protein
MVTAERDAKPLSVTTSAINALRGDYAAIAFLLSADKFGVCSGLFMGKMMTMTESAWREDGKLEPEDLEELKLISLENPVGKSIDRTQIRISPEGERVTYELLSSGDDRIKEIDRAVDEAAEQARADSLNQMYLLLGANDLDYLMMLLATCLKPGESLIAPLSQLPDGTRDVLLTLVDLGLVELRPPINGSEFDESGCLRVHPTGLGEMIVVDLKERGYEKLIDEILDKLNGLNENYEKMMSFGAVKIRGQVHFVN